jgi:hypothetical protein
MKKLKKENRNVRKLISSIKITLAEQDTKSGWSITLISTGLEQQNLLVDIKDRKGESVFEQKAEHQYPLLNMGEIEFLTDFLQQFIASHKKKIK